MTEKSVQSKDAKSIPKFLRKEADLDSLLEWSLDPLIAQEKEESDNAWRKRRQEFKKKNPKLVNDLTKNLKKHIEDQERKIHWRRERAKPKKYVPPYSRPNPEGEAVAKGGMIKKYSYMGGGSVYGQPRKAKYVGG